MQFQELAELQSKTRELKAQRARQAQDAVELAYGFLEQAEADAFRHPEALESALDYFLQAIQLQRNLAEAYFGAAYIFLLRDEKNQALNYLQAIRDIKPHNPDLPIWFEYLQNPQKLPPPISRSKAAEGNDQQRDSLLAAIQALIQENCDLSPASPQAPVCRALETRSDQVEHEYLRFKEQIDLLEKDLDCFELHQALDALRQCMTQIKKTIQNCDALAKLKDELLVLRNQVIQSLNQLSKKQQPQQLERLFDHCDYYADQLDILEQSGISILAIKPYYKQLTQAVETLHDCLDES